MLVAVKNVNGQIRAIGTEAISKEDKNFINLYSQVIPYNTKLTLASFSEAIQSSPSITEQGKTEAKEYLASSHQLGESIYYQSEEIR